MVLGQVVRGGQSVEAAADDDDDAATATAVAALDPDTTKPSSVANSSGETHLRLCTLM